MPNQKKVIHDIEQCTCHVPSACRDCSHYGHGEGCMEELLTDALALLKEQKQQRWIPCSDRLPKSKPDDLEYPTVIIALEDGTVELGCYYESTKEWGAGENFDRLRDPVAWMPLPVFHKEGR